MPSDWGGMKPEVSLPVGLATAAIVWSIFSNATPTVADIRVGEPHDPDIASAERLASWTAAGVVAGISLLTKDPTVFVLGGSMVIALAWWHRHANMVDPASGRAVNFADYGQTGMVTDNDMGAAAAS